MGCSPGVLVNQRAGSMEVWIPHDAGRSFTSVDGALSLVFEAQPSHTCTAQAAPGMSSPAHAMTCSASQSRKTPRRVRTVCWVPAAECKRRAGAVRQGARLCLHAERGRQLHDGPAAAGPGRGRWSPGTPALRSLLHVHRRLCWTWTWSLAPRHAGTAVPA